MVQPRYPARQVWTLLCAGSGVEFLFVGFTSSPSIPRLVQQASERQETSLKGFLSEAGCQGLRIFRI